MIPANLPKSSLDLMGYAPKAVVHLRSQRKRKRLGLMFGAGLSMGLKFPSWNHLVRNLAEASGVSAKVIFDKFLPPPPEEPAVERSLASITHMLFGEFRQRKIEEGQKSGTFSNPITFLNEQRVRSLWLKLIHQVLYSGHKPEQCKETLRNHPYLEPYTQIIRDTPMTVNYNFDDSLEKLLYYSRTTEEKKKSRGFETTFRPTAQFQRESGVIYHPNGYLPSEFDDGSSPSVVFADDSFQDQLIDAAAGRYTHLSSFMQRNTCLLIGLSLEDATLRSLLRKNALTSAGNVHYIVQYIEDDKALDPDICRALFESNFTAYNLITLFLNDQGIRCLGELIRMEDHAFEMDHPKATKKFVYYIVGSIGAGKTTATNNFRNLHTYDEWIEPRRSELARPESELQPAEIKEVNEWIAPQFRMKNYALKNETEGVHLVDRWPLDPLTFGERSTVKNKAAELYRTVTDGEVAPIEQGHVIFLDGDIKELKNRISYKHRYWDERQLQELVDNIRAIYGSFDKSTISTAGKDIQDVIREISHVIFREKYRPIDIGAQLKQLGSP